MFRSMIFALGVSALCTMQGFAQVPGAFSGNTLGIGSGVGRLGNAGGFATGPGFSNGTTASANFGLTTRGLYIAPGTTLGLPAFGVSPNAQMNAGMGMPAVGNAMGMNPMGGAGPGFVPGIAPPGFTKDMFGYDVGLSSSESGYTDFGNAMTSSALGLGFGGMGYGFGTMAYGPMNYGYAGSPFLPGAGYMTPADVAAVATANAAQGQLPPKPSTNVTNVAPGNTGAQDDNRDGNATNNNTAPTSRPSGVRRSFLNDNVPMATANAIRIQNRLHHIKSPNFKSIKVLIAGRTAILSGSVDTKDDEQFAIRMVGLEPGVINVKSELTIGAGSGEPH